MLRDGDMIGNHSWDHPDLKKFSREISKSQITRTTAAIRKATGFRPCLFRFPYGHFRRDEVADARELGFTTIQWDVDTFDWSRPGVRAIYNKVVSRTRPGSIILQHDGTEPGISDDHRRQTVAALPREIDYLRSQGYRFVTVTQLLGYRLIYKQ
jgi:peptidoglycan/xylan/chitin deacetylase (PgdA/CDA1 family)